LEEETALSIVDPATISIEVVGKSGSSDVQGILDATSSEVQQTLEIQAQQVILRLSYNDMKLFWRILDSVPRQARPTSSETPIPTEVDRLQALGFSIEDCQKALDVCGDSLEEAALWLTQNASALEPTPSSSKEIKIRAIEIRTGCLSLCIIDDCRDADVPLLEVATSQLILRQTIDALQANGEGSINCQFSVDYYNRILSGWEPFVEPFKCHARWDFLPFVNTDQQQQRRSIFFDTEEVVNVNFTRALLELFRTVRMNWMEDYYGSSNGRDGTVPPTRHRSPFVPFALQNATGSGLKFKCITASLLTDASVPVVASTSSNNQWIQCEAGDVVAFSFESRGRLRHHDSHEIQSRKLVIELDGWLELSPISVDRVGVYFRYATV